MKEDWHALLHRDLGLGELFEKVTSGVVSGNTYKDLMEATALSSGLSFVLLANLFTAVAGWLLYHFVLGRLNILSDHDVSLLARFPVSQQPRVNDYSPADAATSRAPPPFRWTGWLDFYRGPDRIAARQQRLKNAEMAAAMASADAHHARRHTSAANTPAASDPALRRPPLRSIQASSHPHEPTPAFAERLSRDAQIYLLFLRMCIALTVVCGVVSVAILAPVYLTGSQPPMNKVTGAPPEVDDSPDSTLALTQSAFNRLTSQNISRRSAFQLFQLPVWGVVIGTVVLLYSAMSTVNAKETRYEEWLRRPRRQELVSIPRRDRNTELPGWTIFVRGVPDHIQTNDQFASLLAKIYPNQILRVELLYQGLLRHCIIESRLRQKRRQLEYLDTLSVSNHVRLRRRTCCFCLPAPTPTKQELVRQLETKIADAEQKMNRSRAQVQSGFLNCAFITFRSSDPAETCIDTFPYRRSLSVPRADIPRGSLVTQGLLRFFERFLPFADMSRRNSADSAVKSPDISEAELACRTLGPMRAEVAPKAGDVVWSKIGISLSERIFRDIVVSLIVFVLLTLFTSPVAMITGLRQIITEAGALASSIGPDGFGWGEPKNGTNIVPSITGSQDPDAAAISVSETLIGFLPDFVVKRSFARSFLLLYTPVFLLGLINSLVPSILRSACVFEGYATRSERELSIFTKTVFYFVMNTIVLPSLALNTARELAEILYVQSGGGENVNRALPIVERVFSSDVTYFLCCYLVQLALTVNILMLIRIPATMASWSRRWFAVTPLQLAQAKCSGSFDFACHYAYCIMVLCMCLMFGVTAPAMWAFAAVYFTVKFYVDSYNIYYVHARSHNDGRLARRVADVSFFACVVCAYGYSVVFYLRKFDLAAALLVIMATVALMASSAIAQTAGPLLLRWACSVCGLENIGRSIDSPFYDFVDQEQTTMDSLDSFAFSVDSVGRRESGVIIPQSPPKFHPSFRVDHHDTLERSTSEVHSSLADSASIAESEKPSSKGYGSIALP